MNSIRRILLVLSILIAGNLYAGDFYDVTPVRVIDGDTVVVTIENVPDVFGERIAVRIAGIDTPEIRGKCVGETRKANEAKLLVQNLFLRARVVNVLGATRDKYFRIVGNIEVDGQDVSAILLEKGLARLYDGGRKSDWCSYRRTRQATSP